MDQALIVSESQRMVHKAQTMLDALNAQQLPVDHDPNTAVVNVHNVNKERGTRQAARMILYGAEDAVRHFEEEGILSRHFASTLSKGVAADLAHMKQM
jgi:hypothetical protein